MCYTGICKYENYLGDCCATKEHRVTDCMMSDDFEEGVPPEDEDENE